MKPCSKSKQHYAVIAIAAPLWGESASALGKSILFCVGGVVKVRSQSLERRTRKHL